MTVARFVRARVKSGEAPEFEAIKADVEVLKTNQVVTRAQNTCVSVASRSIP